MDVKNRSYFRVFVCLVFYFPRCGVFMPFTPYTHFLLHLSDGSLPLALPIAVTCLKWIIRRIELGSSSISLSVEMRFPQIVRRRRTNTITQARRTQLTCDRVYVVHKIHAGMLKYKRRNNNNTISNTNEER